MIDDIGRPGRPMADYMRTIRKGWWIVAATVLIVAAATYFVSSQQQPKFQATADDLIVAPTFDPTQKLSSSALTQYVNTQASIAQSPQVAAAALALAPQIKDLTPGKLLKSSTITADPVATVVSFSVGLPHQGRRRSADECVRAGICKLQPSAAPEADTEPNRPRTAAGRRPDSAAQPGQCADPDGQEQREHRGASRRLFNCPPGVAQAGTGGAEPLRPEGKHAGQPGPEPGPERGVGRTRSSPRTRSATRSSASSSDSCWASASSSPARRSTPGSARPSRSHPSWACRCSAGSRGRTRTCESTTS